MSDRNINMLIKTKTTHQIQSMLWCRQLWPIINKWRHDNWYFPTNLGLNETSSVTCSGNPQSNQVHHICEHEKSSFHSASALALYNQTQAEIMPELGIKSCWSCSFSLERELHKCWPTFSRFTVSLSYNSILMFPMLFSSSIILDFILFWWGIKTKIQPTHSFTEKVHRKYISYIVYHFSSLIRVQQFLKTLMPQMSVFSFLVAIIWFLFLILNS